MQRHLLAFYKVAKQRDSAPLRPPRAMKKVKNREKTAMKVSGERAQESFEELAFLIKSGQAEAVWLQ